MNKFEEYKEVSDSSNTNSWKTSQKVENHIILGNEITAGF